MYLEGGATKYTEIWPKTINIFIRSTVITGCINEKYYNLLKYMVAAARINYALPWKNEMLVVDTSLGDQNWRTGSKIKTNGIYS